jgi:hypothetical protein
MMKGLGDGIGCEFCDGSGAQKKKKEQETKRESCERKMHSLSHRLGLSPFLTILNLGVGIGFRRSGLGMKYLPVPAAWMGEGTGKRGIRFFSFFLLLLLLLLLLSK